MIVKEFFSAINIDITQVCIAQLPGQIDTKSTLHLHFSCLVRSFRLIAFCLHQMFV